MAGPPLVEEVVYFPSVRGNTAVLIMLTRPDDSSFGSNIRIINQIFSLEGTLSLSLGVPRFHCCPRTEWFPSSLKLTTLRSTHLVLYTAYGCTESIVRIPTLRNHTTAAHFSE